MSVPYTRRNLFHHRGKLLLSVLGIASAIALIIILMGFKAGLYATLTAFVDNIGADLIVAQSGVQGMFSSNSALPVSIHDKAVEVSGATEAGHILMADIIFTEGETKTPVLLVGYDPDTTFGSPWKLDSGRNIADRHEIALDTWLAQRADISLGQTVDVLGHNFTVTGLTRETSSWMSPYVFIRLDDAEETLGINGIVSYHLLRLPADADIPETITKLEDAIPGIDAMTPDDIADADRRVLANIMDSPINVMLLIGVIIGTAVMGLTAYTAITDRMREFGVLKAVGASAWRMGWLLVTETIYRAVIGYGLGVGLAYLIATIIMARWPQFYILIERSAVLQVGGLAILMSVVAASLPLRRLNQIDPVIVFKA